MRVNQPNHFSEICGPTHFEFRSGNAALKYVDLCALSPEVGNAALKQTTLSLFAKCNHGSTATENNFFLVLWSWKPGNRVGHSLKLLDMVKKCWVPLRKLFAPPAAPSWLRVCLPVPVY